MPPVRLKDSIGPVMHVEGLYEIRKALASLDREYRKAFDAALRGAAQPIAEDAKKRYRALHPRSGPTKGSQRGIRGTVVKAQPTVYLGSPKYPYILGQEWGSKQHRQFPPWIPSPYGQGAVGRFFWPAVLDGGERLYDTILEAVDQANDLHFPGKP